MHQYRKTTTIILYDAIIASIVHLLVSESVSFLRHQLFHRHALQFFSNLPYYTCNLTIHPLNLDLYSATPHNTKPIVKPLSPKTHLHPTTNTTYQTSTFFYAQFHRYEKPPKDHHKANTPLLSHHTFPP